MKKTIVTFILGCLAGILGSVFGSLVIFAKALNNETFSTGISTAISDGIASWVNKTVYGQPKRPTYARPHPYKYKEM